MKPVLSFLIIMLAISIGSKGNTIYVNLLGSDANNGLSKNDPIKTLDLVNQKQFSEGDSILLKGNQTFTGSINVNQHKIYVGSYDGVATITGSYGVYIEGYDSCKIENLKLVGIYESPAYVQDGIRFDLSSPNGTLNNGHSIRIINVDVTGFYGYGICIDGENETKSIEIFKSTIYENLYGGIRIGGFYGAQRNYKNVHIDSCKIFKNIGLSSGRSPSGNGIELNNAIGALVENTETFGNGKETINKIPGSPAGIRFHNVAKSKISNCKSHGNKSIIQPYINLAGNGFAFAYENISDTIENCLSYNNEGAGYNIHWASTDIMSSNMSLKKNTSINDARLIEASVNLFDYGYPYISTGLYATMINLDSNTIFQNKSFTVDGDLTEGVSIKNTTICLTDSAKAYSDNILAHATIFNTMLSCSILAIPGIVKTRPIENLNISITPNPFADIFKITVLKLTHLAQARIISSTGQIVATKMLVKGQNNFNVAFIPKGIYFVQITTDYRIIYSTKLLRL